MNNNNNQYVRKTTYSSTTFIIIVGVLSLIFIIIYIYNNYYSLILPTPTGTIMSSTCPDYWDSIGNSQCQNTNSLGSCSKIAGANIMDFSGNVFTNTNTGDYSKCKWAKACNVSWSNIDRIC
jgi:hypothetical protein